MCEPFLFPLPAIAFLIVPLCLLTISFSTSEKPVFQTRRLSSSNKSLILHLPVEPAVFDQVLGIGSFHGEKSPNFSFKLLIFMSFANIID